MFAIGAMYGGGSERQIIQLLKHLDRTRFEPHLYLVSRMGPLLSQIPEDVPVHVFSERSGDARIYVPGLNYRRRIADYAACLKQTGCHVSYDRTFLMTLTAAAGAELAGVPAVSTVVTDPERGFAPVAGRFQNLKRRRLSRLYNSMAQVLAVSDGARDAAIRFYGIRHDRIRTHRNGVDVAFIEEQRTQQIENDWWTAACRTAGSRVLRVVSAGRLNHDKGFHLLVEAAAVLTAQVPQLDLRIAILGEGENRTGLMNQIRSRNLTEQIQLPGFQENAAAWYGSADLFVLPSLVEGMPNVLLEAMASGTAVIAADCPSGPREILDHGRLGTLVPVNDAAALCVAMQTAEADRERLQRTAESARDTVQADWTVQKAAAELEEILAVAAGGQGGIGKRAR